MISAVVFDDEMFAIKLMKIQLSKIEDIELIGQFTEHKSLLSFIAKNKPNIAFLDIEAPEMDGIGIAKEIKKVSKSTHIIFVTAFKDYAFKAFEVYAKGYLLKPVKLDRLKKVIDDLRPLSINNFQNSEPTFLKYNIKTFGKFEVVCSHKHIFDWRTKKTKELFAFLIHNLAREVTTEIIIEALWADKELSKAKNLLYTTISYLKKSLPENILTANNNTYLLDNDEVELDSFIFESKVKSLLSGNWNEEQIQTFEKINNLYSGGYFEYENYDWSIYKKNIFERNFLMLSDKALLAYNESHDTSNQIILLEKLIDIDRYNESYYIKLINLYAQANDTTRCEMIAMKHKMIKEEIQ
jgi:two-component system, LytTR family, response regulator